MTSPPNSWHDLVSDAVDTDDPVICNFRITRAHYLLSQALRDAVSPAAGANFHSWAVWGSRKAGVTIRQEDKDKASRDATVVAGIVGGLVGVVVGWFWSRQMGSSGIAAIATWSVIGCVVGGYCGYLLAGYTRSAASRLILAGNRIVLDDIGRETGRYLDYVYGHAGSFDEFLEPFRSGETADGGQVLLRRAFVQYERARLATDAQTQQQANYFANCLAILHEHIRLQPYISRSLPFLIKKCVTQRLMTYSVGEQLLSVHEDVPPLGGVEFPATLRSLEDPELVEFLTGQSGWDRGLDSLKNTGACDWTKITDRMAYVVNLFRSRHLDENVVAAPYSEEQLAAIDNGKLPARPW